MVGYKETTHNTEFMISAKPLPSMDNINLVIGRVIEGMDFLNEARLNKIILLLCPHTPLSEHCI
jgi:cyclophilin family peptidyl-prolyl cis-trans isomerase